MEAIKQWINDGGTYQEGVQLFLQFSDDQGMCELFTAEMETEFKRKTLKRELMQLLNQKSAVCYDGHDENTGPVHIPADEKLLPAGSAGGSPVASEKMTKRSPKTPGRWSAVDQMDPQEKQLHDQWHPIFLEMTHMQSTIYDVALAGKTDKAKQDEACRMAHRILDLARQCKRIYHSRDEYFKTGQVWVDPNLDGYAVDPITAWKKLQNAERYVRQMKNNLAKNPGDELSKQNLAKHQAAVDHYKKTFNW
jgi:hypothetical protein